MTGGPENKPRTSGAQFYAWQGGDSRIHDLNGELRVELVDAYGASWHGDLIVCRAIWARIADEVGHCVVVCIDGREESLTRYRMFEGARRPERPGAVLVALGSPDEDLIVAALSRWCDSDDPDKRGYSAEFKEALHEALLRLRLCDPGGS